LLVVGVLKARLYVNRTVCVSVGWNSSAARGETTTLGSTLL
jgi:hypothetical protein